VCALGHHVDSQPAESGHPRLATRRDRQLAEGEGDHLDKPQAALTLLVDGGIIPAITGFPLVPRASLTVVSCGGFQTSHGGGPTILSMLRSPAN
jgi:hypothetical protein